MVLFFKVLFLLVIVEMLGMLMCLLASFVSGECEWFGELGSEKWRM